MTYFEHEDAIRVTTRRTQLDKVRDEGTQQLVDFRGLKGEKPQKVWRPMDFGFFSVPPKDSDGVIIQMGSRADRSLYMDGGHKDYRPKQRPAGSSGLYDQYGNLIQTDKDQIAVTHAKKIVFQLGKGYDAKGANDYNGPTISIVVDGSSMTLTFGSSSVKLEDGKITHTSPHVAIVSDHVDLGAEGGIPVKRCDDSCATKVYAV